MSSTFRRIRRRTGVSLFATVLLVITGCTTLDRDAGEGRYQSADPNASATSRETLNKAPRKAAFDTNSTFSRKSAHASPELVGSVESNFENGNKAYRGGNLVAAENHYNAVISLQPQHRRAHFNRSMLYLHRAWQGLHQYLAFEPDADRRSNAQNILQQLEKMNPDTTAN